MTRIPLREDCLCGTILPKHSIYALFLLKNTFFPQKICVYAFFVVPLQPILKNACFECVGEMAEWSIAAVLKTVELRGSGGSNPSLSAKQNEKRVRQGSFFCAQWWTKLVLGHNRGQKKKCCSATSSFWVVLDAMAGTEIAKESTPNRKEKNTLSIGFYAFLKKNARLLVYLLFLQYLCRRFYKNRFRQCF